MRALLNCSLTVVSLYCDDDDDDCVIQYWDFRERSLRAVTALKDHTTALKDHRGALNDPQVLEFQCKTHPQN